MHPEAAMFERLDPPEPFRPGPAFHDAVVARGRRIRRRRRRVAGVALSSVVVLAGVVGVAAGWSKHQWEHVKRVEIGAAPEHVDALGGTPFNVLVAGLDAPSVDPAVVGERTDTMVVVRIEPAAKKVEVVSLPRDLWVSIPAHGEGRLNTAYDLGGAQLLIRTIEETLGVPVDRYLAIDFTGFRDLVDRAGGVRVRFPYPARAASTGLDVPTAGCVTLDGAQSLSLVRARKDFSWLIDGQWRFDRWGDLGRMQRQQTFGRAVLAALGDIGTDPVSEAHLLDLFVHHVTMDSYWTREQLDGVFDLARALGPDDVSTRTIPVTDAVKGQAQVLLPGPEATDVFASLRGDRPDAHPGAAESPPPGEPTISPC
jgi:LCP family protein required for cell wall assembly